MESAHQSRTSDLRSHYDRLYHQPDYYGHQLRLNRAYLQALVNRAGLPRGSSVLDVGCGQGFFTALFAQMGYRALGVDLSPMGIAVAKQKYQAIAGSDFRVMDVRDLPSHHQFDCVFVRSCSAYNTPDFSRDRTFTDRLLGHVKTEGCLLFLCNTNLRESCRTNVAWKRQSLADARTHFRAYGKRAQIYFSLRVPARLLGALAISNAVSVIDAAISRWCGIGGDIIAVIRK